MSHSWLLLLVVVVIAGFVCVLITAVIYDRAAAVQVHSLLVQRDELLAALKECRDATAAAMRVVADLDASHLIGDDTETRQKRFIEELRLAGVTNGFGKRADAAIKNAEAIP